MIPSLNTPPPPWTNFHLSAPNRVLHSLRFDRPVRLANDPRCAHPRSNSEPLLHFFGLPTPPLLPPPPMATFARPRIPRRELADVFLGMLQPVSFLRASSLTVDTCSLGWMNRLFSWAPRFARFTSSCYECCHSSLWGSYASEHTGSAGWGRGCIWQRH